MQSTYISNSKNHILNLDTFERFSQKKKNK